MALRNILKSGEDILKKVCRPVEKFDRRLAYLLDDLNETMATADGIGLAAPQVGVLKRAAVIHNDDQVIELVNPEIIESCGEQRENEGCLSFPGKYGVTVRPQWVKVRAQNRQGKTFEVKGEGLLARALCHEIDHLNGVLFFAHVIEEIDPEEN